MPVQWKGTKYKGVRYYEHPTRKHGIAKDKYFAIRYQRDGKRIEEGLGWGSKLDPKDKKHWTAEKAYLILAELKEVAKGLKQGPSRLSRRQHIEKNIKEAAKGEQERIAKENITLKQYFENTYYPDAKINKRRFILT